MLKWNDKYAQALKQGDFGLERECIRVNKDGVLSHRPHPKCFGNKLVKKHITTDFSESQIEMITPVFDSVVGMFEYAQRLYDFVAANLDGEYLWCQSMPCIIDGEIPVAQYPGEAGHRATEYREMLVERYGGEKQLISGIHFNFSLDEKLLHMLYEDFGKGREYAEFVDKIYLKITRNYLRYGFLITYLCGCSNVCHSSFDKRCVATLEQKSKDTYCTKTGVSLRNSKWGYRNLQDLFPSYESREAYIASIEEFIAQGKISYAKEYYSSVRLKGKLPMFESLKDGIQYIELRTIDINPFIKTGADVRDLQFTHLFLLLMLVMEEDCNKDYQQDGQDAKEAISLCGLMREISICGKSVCAKKACAKLIDLAEELNAKLGLYDTGVIDFVRSRLDFANTYSAKNLQMDFISDSLTMMREYTKEAQVAAKNFTWDEINDMLDE